MAKKTRKAKIAKEPARPKKRNPQDTTLRNSRAASRRLGLLEDQIGTLTNEVIVIRGEVTGIRGDLETAKAQLAAHTARLDQAATIIPTP